MAAQLSAHAHKCTYCGRRDCPAGADYDLWLLAEIQADRRPDLRIRKFTHHALQSHVRFRLLLTGAGRASQ